MTNERREEVVLIAIVVSLVVHVGLMFLVKPQTMTHVVSQTGKSPRRAPMRMVQRAERPEPTKIAELLDLKALKDAPALVSDRSMPVASMPSVDVLTKTKVPVAIVPTSPNRVVENETVFEVRPVGSEQAPEPVLPVAKIDTPKLSFVPVPAPEFSMKVPDSVKAAAPSAPEVVRAPDSAFLPSKLKTDEKKVDFTPVETIYEKVDEAVVKKEKSAVRELVNADEAGDLSKFVNVTMTATRKDGWRYFRVMMTPRTHLKVVPKDVVLLIDGSGSIGNDRLAGCRKAAQRILRSCTNTGDRFNLVVFRNAFTYAFRNWRECDAESFAVGEAWLMKQTAHGRTDVFSTISSVLTLPRDPKRPLIALVVTDGDANAGVSDTAEILSKFTALNDGLVSIYMYGVKSSANRELIDVLTHGNRGEGFIFDGWRWNAGEDMESLSDKFRDPVLSDLRIVFASGVPVEAYPRLLRNFYRGECLSLVGRVPANATSVSFSLKGINGADAYEGFFTLPLLSASEDSDVREMWERERDIDRKLGNR